MTRAPQTPGPSRRSLLAGLTGAIGAAATPSLAMSEQLTAAGAAQPRSKLDLSLVVNGRPRALSLDPRTTLLDALRTDLGLTGTKKGCDHGQCGACTVHVNGRRVLSCLTLAASVRSRTITTIEGLANGDELHPMQAAFVEHDALQCGYCTPGQIMSAVACVEEGHVSNEEEIREYMSGNLCRCAAYPKIVAAVRDAASKMRA